LSTAAIFACALAALIAYAMWRGGAPERLAAGAMALAALATAAAGLSNTFAFRQTEWQLAIIDLTLLAVLTALALVADRFWPMWLSALQALAMIAHVARAIDPHIAPGAYWWALGKISWPMLFVVCAGIFRHDQRLRAGFPEHAWSHTR
jgi:hypothetical protein